jgi:diguanylate cyclase (GGDEF)-like protein
VKDIFLSYAEEDFYRIQAVARALSSQGWSVFIDRQDIPLGCKLCDGISEHLEAARCIVVIWSKYSVKSHYITQEAGTAQNRLIQILIDEVRPPYGFRDIHTGNLIGWDENIYSPSMLSIYRQIATVLAEPQPAHPVETSRQSSNDLSSEDPTTGLITQPLFCDRLTQALLQAERTGDLCAVMTLDLDNFKAINDRWGHASGDRLLREVAKRLQSSVRVSDTVARLHGDEFGIILQNLKSTHNAGGAAEKILENISAPLEFKDLPSTVSTSIGIAIYPSDGAEVDTLLNAADLAMYEAKKQGRTRYRYFTRDLEANALKQLGFEQDLCQALSRNEFILHYQPQICLTTHRVISVEALLRWNHYARGLVMPSRFLSVLENKRLISDVGEWALRQACQHYKEWQTTGCAPARVAVNVSAFELREKRFVTTVREILQQIGVEPSTIEFEIDAGRVFDDELVRKTLEALKDEGILITLDRFASGYPVQTLHDYPIDAINIEATVVGRIASDNTQLAIIDNIIELGRALEIPVVAEGVENLETDRTLRRLGCRFAQGFLYSAPLPPGDFAKWMQKRANINESLGPDYPSG